MRYVFAFAVVLAAALIALISFGGASQDRVVLTTATGTYTFQIDLADDDSERAKGLMFRQKLDPDAGMLFDFGEERPVAFWMRNTFISLDMIFVAADGTVKKIHEKAIPQDPTSIPSDVPVRFVLEIPGGRANEIGLMPGDKLEHPLVEDS